MITAVIPIPAVIPIEDQVSTSTCPLFSSNLQARSCHSILSLPAMRIGSTIVMAHEPRKAADPVERVMMLATER